MNASAIDPGVHRMVKQRHYQRESKGSGLVGSPIYRTRIGTLFLTEALHIHKLESCAAYSHKRIMEIFNRLDHNTLKHDVEDVLRTQGSVERRIHGESRTIYLMHIHPCRSADYVTEGAVVTLFDISTHTRHEIQELPIASIVEGARDAIIGQALDGTITSWNTAARQLFGFSAEEAIGQPISLLFADYQAEGPAIPLERRREDKRTPPLEISGTHKDGHRIDVELTVSPVVNNAGNRVATSVIARDVTERVARDKHRDILLEELNHRIKNMLATLQSIMLQTLANTPAMTDFRTVFLERIQALSNTHDLLTRSDRRSASLSELIEAELRPYGRSQDPPWRVTGETIQVKPAKAITLGLAFHELATNAAKHGALSRRQGRVEINWKITETGDRPMLDLKWVERGGPSVDKPRQSGFGFRLIEQGLAHELEAEVGLDLKPGGLRCALEIPLEQIAEDAPPG